MSVVQFINKASGQFNLGSIPDTSSVYGYVTNPLKTNLDCRNPLTSQPVDIQNCGTLFTGSIATDEIKAPVLSNNITLLSSMRGNVDISCNLVFTQGVNLYEQTRFRNATTFYVSPLGNDSSNNGSQLYPYLTIQQAIAQSEANSSATNLGIIAIAPGVYNENLTFNAGYTWLMSNIQNQDLNQTVVINGDINIAISTIDNSSNTVGLVGINLIGDIFDNSTTFHNLTIQNSWVYGDKTVLSQFSTANKAYTQLINSYFSHSVVTIVAPQSLIDLRSGSGYIVDCIFDSSDNQCLIDLGPFADNYYFENNDLISNNDDVGLLPIVNVQNANPHTFISNYFKFTSPVVKTTGSSCGIFYNNVGNTTYEMYRNTFSLLGTSHPTQHTVTSALGGTLTINQINNYCNPVGTDKVGANVSINNFNVMS